MKLFAKYIQAILDGEVNVHNGYMADFGITQEELDQHRPSRPGEPLLYLLYAQRSLHGAARRSC